MNKENILGDTGPRGTGGTEADERSVVDIGITVDVSDISDPAGETAAAVELEFDESELLEADDAATESGSGSGAGSESRSDAGIDPDEREALEGVDIDPDAIADKEYSYRTLLDEGVDEAIADALRRRYSLPWSFEGDGDLDRRSDEVRGLGDAEREWIAVSGDEEWQAFEYEHSEPIAVGRERPSERPYPKPTPVTAVTGVGPDDADALAEAGVRSAERLATIDAMAVASALDLNVLHVRSWRHNAREQLE